MDRGEESGEEKAEFLWGKLRNVGKRGGNSTPSASFWRRNELHGSLGIISSRKLAAALWELHQYKPLTNMRRRVTVPPPPLKLPKSWSNSRRRVADLLMQHHRSSIETSNHATQTVSPSSCSSSMEIAPCNPATSSSSIELKGRNGELTYSFRTSTQVLKVLNRVWSLEEQHVSNISLIKALKKELGRARFHAKESARYQQGGRREMVEHISGGKPVRKNRAKVESTRGDELEHERKLRKQSESLQRELAEELYEVKRSLASVSKELEKERSSRGFLEELCDELAWAVIDCEKELRDQRQKSDKDLGERDDHDHLLLRISQVWLDERMQQHRMTIQNERNGNQMVGNPMHRRSSLESIPMNLGASARREEEDDDDDGSSSSHSTCFEVDKINECSLKPQGQKLQENHFEEKLESSDRRRALSPWRLQAKFEEHMARATSHGQKISISHKAEAVKRNTSDDKRQSEGISELDSNYVINNLIRYYHSFSENGMPVNKDDATASSLCEWTQKLPAQDLDTSETPSKFLSELKESTLREKLSEARLKGQKSRSSQRASIYPFRGE